jgi:hypothetical protein
VFESSTTFLLFEHFRVPYRVVPADRLPWLASQVERHPLRECGELVWKGSAGPRSVLRWPRFDAEPSPVRTAGRPGGYRLGPARLYGHLLPDEVCERWLSDTEIRWSKSTPILDERGRHVASEWLGHDGSRFVPYDPSEIIHNYWSETYRDLNGHRLGASAKGLGVAVYYRLKPLLPRASQIRMRRLFSRVQARTKFPRWPIETALHDFYTLLLQNITDGARDVVPWLAPWPDGYSWAFVLTHDVETSNGYENLHVLRDIEVEYGYRSSWNFVPKRYATDDAVVDALKRDGFEVGVHGLYHDGRDLESLSILSERLPMIREYADRWRAVGFRSPATHRVWEWMPLLGFEYDSSYPDTDPFEPKSGGCCSWLPFFNEGMVELPITLPQDHTLFSILRDVDGQRWTDKAELIRRQRGMALVLTHPDYALDDRSVAAYRTLLQRFSGDSTAWRALPCQISAWWRRRAASKVEPIGSGWRVVGPAAEEARIEQLRPSER